MHALREAEDWLEGDGYSSTYEQYSGKFNELNKRYTQLKMRKEEYEMRDPAVESARKRTNSYHDKVDEISNKKPWITDDHKKDMYERMNETLAWLDE